MNTRNQVRSFLLTLTLILSVVLGTSAVAQEGPPALFGDAVGYDLAGKQLDSHIIRARYVTVNSDMLFDYRGRPLGVDALPQISLNLFADASFTANVKNAWQDEWGSYWTGNLSGVPGSYFYLTVVDGAFMAHVGSVLGIYEVSYTPEGVYRAIQINQSAFIDDDPSWQYAEPGNVLREGELGDAADNGSIIDVMVAYTDDARVAAGGTPAMKATILTALNETNTSYANSGVIPRLRLVHVEEYLYAETGDLGTDLQRLTNTTDTYFTTVHSLRNTYAADMVSLIVENGGAYCGLANAIMATSANAFQVTDRECATGYYSFGHEFGHLQGARHDKYVDHSNTPYAYGHGFVHRSVTPAARWRTVMAYNDACAAQGYDCTRLQYWSNPNTLYSGAAMGAAGSSENYRVLNETAFTVANFRHVRIGNNFNSSFNGSSAGWSKVFGTWVISNGKFYRSNGASSRFASAKRSGTYGDLTYEVKMKRTGCANCGNMLIIRGKSNVLNSKKYWNSSYLFDYSNTGLFSVWRVNSNGTFTALKDWTPHAAVTSNWNTLKVVAVGKLMKFYINGTLVWVGTDTTFKTGQVGVGFNRETAAKGVIFVDWAKLSNTPTADVNEQIVPGGESISGGEPGYSP